MTWLDPYVLTEPCWLEEYLTVTGVADLDWTRRIPDEVITVVTAMHRRLTDQGYPYPTVLATIAAHFTAAGDVHAAAQARTARLRHRRIEARPLGGRWVPSPARVDAVLEAPGRRTRRALARAEAALQAPAGAQLPLFDLPGVAA